MPYQYQECKKDEGYLILNDCIKWNPEDKESNGHHQNVEEERVNMSLQARRQNRSVHEFRDGKKKKTNLL